MANAVIPPAPAPAPVPCPRCDGTGYMGLEDYLDSKDRDGTPPVRVFGCPKCEGLGEIEAEEALKNHGRRHNARARMRQ